MISNVLLLTSISYKNINSKPESYSIWDAYREALQSLIKNFHAYDHYDIYFSNGKEGFKNFIEEIIRKNKIKYLFIGYAAEDYTFNVLFLQYLKNTYKLCIINTTQDPPLYTLAQKEEWQLSDAWYGYSQHSYVMQPLPSKYLTAKEIVKFRDNAFHEYFENPKYLNMLEKKFGKK